MNLSFDFKTEAQRQFAWSKARNNCFSGGFNNGKSWVGCLRQFLCLSTFSKYRSFIARQTLADLKKTTMETFFKLCPNDFIEQHNGQDGYTLLKNGSEVLWGHLDAFDEKSLRGLEINSAFIDQAEEIPEAIFLVLDGRIGRWDKAEVPLEMQRAVGSWPQTALGNPKVPNFFDIACNPDTTFHWIYRRFHYESMERRPNYFFIEAESEKILGDPETYKEMLSRDPEWVAKYVKGMWGTSSAQIHKINPESIIDYDEHLLSEILSKGCLFRSFDHGDSGTTCCLWVSAYKGVYIFYREYYSANNVISNHRRNISSLSGIEEYEASYADPSIFRKQSQKDGGFWTVADEYRTDDIDAPPLFFLKADNNEFATRNRINELLGVSSRFKHPVTNETPAPGIYFIKRGDNYGNGCYHSITQLQSQRKKYIGSDNGKSVYLDDRDDSIADHAYDPVRYFIAMHGASPKEAKKKAPYRSFAHFNALLNNKAFHSYLSHSVSRGGY